MMRHVPPKRAGRHGTAAHEWLKLAGMPGYFPVLGTYSSVG